MTSGLFFAPHLQKRMGYGSHWLKAGSKDQSIKENALAW
jgi:hypothetical protein